MQEASVEEIAALEMAVEQANINVSQTDIDLNTEISLEELDAKRKMLKEYEQAYQEMNAYIQGSKVDSTYIEELIKIPDVYSIELTFTSLIPDNFNNYLYGFRAGNLDPIQNYFNGNVDEIGAFEKLVQQLQDAMKPETNN